MESEYATVERQLVADPEHAKLVARTTRELERKPEPLGVAERALRSGEVTGSAADGWPEPRPLRSDMPSVEPFDAALLPEALRVWCVDISERMQVPLDYPAAFAVLALAGAVGRRAVIQPKARDSSWRVVPNLWGAVVGEPGLMKSPALSTVLKPLKLIESALAEEYKQTRSEYDAETEQAALRVDAWKMQFKVAAKDGNETPPRPAAESEPPSEKRLTTNDATVEKLHEILSDNPAGILLVRDELSGWLATFDRKGREADRSFYLETWNGDGGFRVDRIARGSVCCSALCVSLVGCFHPSRLKVCVADVLTDGIRNDGLLQRFQIVVWPDQLRAKDWQLIDRAPNKDAESRAFEVFERLVRLPVCEPADEPWRFSPEAQRLFDTWLTELEQQRIRSESEAPAMRAHISKYRSLFPSLALLFHLADGLESFAVGIEHTRQAAAWCGFLESHARRIYGTFGTPAEKAARNLLARLESGVLGAEGCFTPREAYRHHWAKLGTPEEVRAAAEVLVSAGWLRPLEPDAEQTGRPSEAYLVFPEVRL